MNATTKILAKAADRKKLDAGEFIEAKIDKILIHDLTGPLAVEAFNKLSKKKIWDKDRVIVVLDHTIPANSIQAAQLHKSLREFVKVYGITYFYDVGRGGICHQIMPEKGHVAPGEVIVGADSHTCTYGAFGAFATGIGSTDAAAVLATGMLWFKVPEVVQIEITGDFQNYVASKDLILHIAGTIGADGANYRSIEFTGSTIKQMSIDSRMTLSNMVIEVGAKSGIIEPDSKAIEYVKARNRNASFVPIYGDPNASYAEKLNFNVDDLEPQVACPHSVDNVKPVSELSHVEIDQAFLGSCTNGRIEDLSVAAHILRGKHVKEGVRMIVIPASQEIFKTALKDGLAKIFVEAGAYFGGPTCGPCMGSHSGILANGETCISSTNRNFLGRMGNPQAEVYLASPATVAASAIKGRITNPKEVMNN
ncbi:MAG: 3-isopropylmalate dehydratase large subunit [Candidatus Bathyarchaeota archaeon]